MNTVAASRDGAASTDGFQDRLNQINEEIRAIVGRGELERDLLFRYNVGLPVQGRATRSDAPPSAGDAALATSPFIEAERLSPLPPSTAALPSDLVKRLVRATVVTEMRGLEEFVKEIVGREWDAKLRELDVVLRGRFASLKNANDGMGAAVMELSDAIAQGLDRQRQDIADLTSSVKKQFRQTERRMDEIVKSREAAETELQDALKEVQGVVRGTTRHANQRVDELVRRHHEVLQDSLAQIESNGNAARDEYVKLLRAHSRAQQEEVDRLHRHVAQLHGAVSGSSDSIVRWTTDMRELLEEGIQRRSEMRSCRRDVSRLEMLVRSMGSGQPQVEAPSESPFHSGPARPVHALPVQFVDDIMGLKERVAFLLNVTERLDRRVGAMDAALRRGPGGPISIPGSANSSIGMPTPMFPAGQGGSSSRRDPTTVSRTSHGSSGFNPSPGHHSHPQHHHQQQQQQHPHHQHYHHHQHHHQHQQHQFHHALHLPHPHMSPGSPRDSYSRMPSPTFPSQSVGSPRVHSPPRMSSHLLNDRPGAHDRGGPMERPHSPMNMQPLRGGPAGQPPLQPHHLMGDRKLDPRARPFQLENDDLATQRGGPAMAGGASMGGAGSMLGEQGPSSYQGLSPTRAGGATRYPQSHREELGGGEVRPQNSNEGTTSSHYSQRQQNATDPGSSSIRRFPDSGSQSVLRSTASGIALSDSKRSGGVSTPPQTQQDRLPGYGAIAGDHSTRPVPSPQAVRPQPTATPGADTDPLAMAARTFRPSLAPTLAASGSDRHDEGTSLSDDDMNTKKRSPSEPSDSYVSDNA